MGSVKKINSHVYKISNHLPRAWIVGKLSPVKQGAIEEVTMGSFDPARSAITKGDLLQKYNIPYHNKISTISFKKNNHIHIELESDRRGILVLSESSYPGWRVFVDGEEEDCLWLNLFFQGVEVEEGYHKIDFIFHLSDLSKYLPDRLEKTPQVKWV